MERSAINTTDYYVPSLVSHLSFSKLPGTLSKPPSLPSEFTHLAKLLDSLPHYDMPRSLFRSSYSLSNVERAVIDNKITTIDSSISTLEGEIAKLKTAIGIVNNRIEGLTESRKHHLAVLSPIRTLPNEILSRIFSYVIDEIDVCEKTGPVYDLMKVCWRWLNVTESTSILWRKFTVKTQGDVDPKMITSRIQNCLKLSRIWPLSITLRETATCSTIMEEKYIPMCLDKQKVEELRLDGGVSAFLFDDLPVYPSYKMIKRLSICSCELTSWWSLYAALFCMESLEELSLKDTTVDMESILDSDLEAIVHLKFLKSLHLENVSTLVYKCAIILFRVPELSKLRIVESSFDRMYILGIVTNVIRASRCPLKTLQLKVEAHPEDILSLLANFSHITSLSLEGPSISQCVLFGISYTLMDLEMLDLRFDMDFEKYSEPISSIVNSVRVLMDYYTMRLSRPLREVKCSLSKTDFKCYDQILKDLVKYGTEEMGVVVKVAWYPNS